MSNDVSLEVKHQERNRKLPWIGVGESGFWTSLDQALHDCGLDFEVSSHDALWKYEGVMNPMMPSAFQVSATTYNEVPDIQVNVIDGTDRIVGVTSDRYSIIQNKQAFSLLQPFLDLGGAILQGGMTMQGMCFMVLECGNRGTVLGDDFRYYVCAMNSFNGKFPMAVFITPVRVVCQNMFRKLMKNDNVMSIKHASNGSDRVEQAKLASSSMASFISDFHERANELMLKKASPYDFASMLFKYPNKNSVKNYDRSCERVDEMREVFVNEYVMAPDNMDNIDNMWGMANAYYDYMSHRPEAKNMWEDDWNDRRLSGIMSGKDIDTKLFR